MNAVLRKPLVESEVIKAVRQVAFECGEPKPGAMSRIQEYITKHDESCSRNTIRKALDGVDGWRFSEKRLVLLDRMITEGFSLSRKFSTGRPRKSRK